MVADVRLLDDKLQVHAVRKHGHFTMHAPVCTVCECGKKGWKDRGHDTILGNVHVLYMCMRIGGTRLRPLGFDRHSVTEKWEGFIGWRLFLRD
jgi:hypothetical protein